MSGCASGWLCACAVHALQLRGHSSLMKPGFLVHSPCVTHVSHLMSSSAHAPLPALAASATSHQPHARWHVVAMKRRLRTQCSSLAHPAHRSSSTHGAGRPLLQRSHESGHSSRMKAWLSWHCPSLIQCSQSAEASEHRPVMTISSPARTAWKMIRLEFSLICLPLRFTSSACSVCEMYTVCLKEAPGSSVLTSLTFPPWIQLTLTVRVCALRIVSSIWSIDHTQSCSFAGSSVDAMRF
mmetsp:Transcript_44447/g.106789  ORF Transcript_44447/g.106789 Transcript_44447/m.106789 type:complete len:239 (+) Transcript_44447:144-860(+)